MKQIEELAQVDEDVMERLPRYARLAVMEAKRFAGEPALKKRVAANARCRSCRYPTKHTIACHQCLTIHPGDVRLLDHHWPVAQAQDDSTVSS